MPSVWWLTPGADMSRLPSTTLRKFSPPSPVDQCLPSGVSHSSTPGAAFTRSPGATTRTGDAWVFPAAFPMVFAVIPEGASAGAFAGAGCAGAAATVAPGAGTGSGDAVANAVVGRVAGTATSAAVTDTASAYFFILVMDADLLADQQGGHDGAAPLHSLELPLPRGRMTPRRDQSHQNVHW